MNLPQTLAARLHGFARETPERVALREKRLGVWHEVSYAEHDANVRRAAWALAQAGVRPGDHVAILSDNRPEWLIVDLGAQAIGARSVGIYQTSPATDVAYVLSDCGARLLFCEDQEQVDKAVACAADTPSVKRVVVFDPRGTRGVADSRLVAWRRFLDDAGEPPAAWYQAELAARDPDAPAMIVYTSGTTGRPKGAMLSNRNVLEGSAEVCQQMGITADDTLSYLPLCHVAEKIFTLFLPLTVGCTVHFGESIATVQADLREVSPTVFLGVPRIWEKMHAGITLRMKDASWLKRVLYRSFSSRGPAIAERRLAGRTTMGDRVLTWLGERFVYAPLKERLGLRRCRVPISGAAPISRDLLRWFHGIGVPILEGYGQTEGAGVSHINRPGQTRLGSVGRPLPQVECQIADDGEILVRGSNVFRGYLNRPDATRETVDEEGWLHTGDVGVVDGDGFLTITGRKKEILITSGGKNLSPESIENSLKTSAYIKEAVAIGDARNFVSALVQIEYEAVSDWASRRGIVHTSYADLAVRPEVVELVGEEIDRANELLSRVEQVRSFRILPKELHEDDGELTATQKVRRRNVLHTYEGLIESMYRSRHRVTTFVQLCASGLALGAAYALVALGFVVIYRASRVFNFAQGDLLAFGAMFMTTCASLGLPWPLALAATMIVTGFLGAAIERVALRPLVGKPVFVTIILTIFVGLLLRAAVMVIWGADPRGMPTPWERTGSVTVGGANILWSSIAAVVAGAVALGLFFLLIKRTRLGVAMRATSNDQEVALALGIPVGRVFAATWFLSGAYAALAGVFLAMFPSSAEPNLAFVALRAFPAVIVGGLESPPGTVIAGLLLGLLEVLAQGYINPRLGAFGHSFHTVFPYLMMILFLMVRPYGIFGRKEVERL